MSWLIWLGKVLLGVTIGVTSYYLFGLSLAMIRPAPGRPNRRHLFLNEALQMPIMFGIAVIIVIIKILITVSQPMLWLWRLCRYR